MKLVLGTVSFGIDGYSLPNAGNPKPSIKTIFGMLDYAFSNGIEFIDTGNAYGNSEDILGKYGIENIKITSKLKPNCLDGLREKEIFAKVRQELQQDLTRLKIDKMWGYYFHTPKYIYNKEAVNSLFECKKEGLVDNIGVSIYEPTDAINAAKMKLDIIQVPYNILDQRLHQTDFFKIAKESNITVFGRSPYLKGLLTIPIDKIPSHLVGSVKHIRKIDTIISKYKLTRIEASLLFSITSSSIDYVVFGVDTLSQLVENIRIYTNKTQCDECFAKLRHQFQKIPDYVVMPSLWKK